LFYVRRAALGLPAIPISGSCRRRDIKMFMGDSVGHWEGDTLVIDTTNQNGRTWFDMVGDFTTPNIHVVEHLTPIDSNAISYGHYRRLDHLYSPPEDRRHLAAPS
jgi:hypothetical protein